MRTETLKREHVERLAEQGCEVGELLTKPDYLRDLLAVGPGFAGVVDDGVVGILGMCEQLPDNYRCWAHTDRELASRHFVALNRAMRAFLTEFRKPRIETVVFVGNEQGRRWAELHGFQQEGVMRNYHAGFDAWLYARINRG